MAPSGAISRDGTLHGIAEIDTPNMMERFDHKVFKMRLAEEKITQAPAASSSATTGVDLAPIPRTTALRQISFSPLRFFVAERPPM